MFRSHPLPRLVQPSTHPRRLLSLVLVLIAAAGCATNPVTGKREIALVSEGQELQIGQEGDKAVAAEYGLYTDAELSARVNDIGQRLARVSHRPGIQWHFQIVDDPTVNAFALPGGYIYVTRGILAHLNSDAQLAGVLGHEIAHVTARHSVQQISRAQLANIGLGVAGLFSEGFRRFSGAAQTGLAVLFLKYGRDDETQADELGIEYAATAGFDPRQVPATYALLKRIGEKAGQRLPTFLSTHPDPGDRETRTTALAAQAAAGKTGLLVRVDAYKRSLQDVVFGQDPRHGYFEGDRLYHPELRFVMDLPAGWQKENGRTAVVAVAPGQRAGMQLSLVAAGSLSPSQYVARLQQQGQIADSEGRTENIGGYPAWAGYLAVVDQNNQQTVLLAVYIRQNERMVQILGRTAARGDSDEDRIFDSARSFRPLTEAARLTPTPERIHIATVPRTGLFEAIVPGLGTQALDVEATALLNGLFPDDRIDQGQLVKIVQPGRRR